MKRIITVLTILAGILIFILPAHAGSREWTLYLYKDMATGVTTAPSGTSTMVVEGGGANRSQDIQMITGLDKLTSETWVVQIDDITVGDAQQNYGGDYSGATFTLRYKESIYQGSNHLEKATTTNVFNGTALSGDTRVQTQIFPVAMGTMVFEWISGITPFSGATVTVRAYDDK